MKSRGEMRKMPYMNSRSAFLVRERAALENLSLFAKKKLNREKNLEKQSNKHRNYEQKYFRLQVSWLPRRLHFGLYREDFYVHFSASSKHRKRVKSDSKIYKASLLKDNQFKVNRLLAVSSFFIANNDNGMTFAAARCLFRCLAASRKKTILAENEM